MILINPKSTKFGIFQRYVPLSVPIGIGSLAGFLRQHQLEVEIIDEDAEPLSLASLKETVAKVQPPYLFGISSLTACIKRSYEIAQLLKQLYPDSKIILGGIHPTVLPDEVLAHTDIDFVVRREGEEILLELYRALKNNEGYSSIKGLSFRVGSSVVHNEAARLPDLSRMLPFPYYLFEKYSDRYNFGFIASSRGCPYDCIFCSQRSISGQKFRYVPTDIVIGEIDLLIHKYLQIHINFVDDNFTVNKQRILELLNAMIEKEFYKKATFDCQTRADAIDEDVLTLLKTAGFRLINFGFETASERLMHILKKKETVGQHIEAVKLSKKYGFAVSGTFIFGLPTETKKERWQAYQLAKALNLDYVRFNNATPYPGTQLYEMAKAEGRLFADKDWTNLNACASLVQDSLTEAKLPYVPTTCDEKSLKKDIIKANLYFSLRPLRIFKLLVKRVGPAGWFYLPPRWYLKPREWFSLLRLGGKLLSSLVRVLF